MNDLNVKVAFIGPANLAPYYSSRFNALAKLIPQATYIRDMAYGEISRQWSFRKEDIEIETIDLSVNGCTTDVLKKINPDILFCIGYSRKRMLKSALWAKAKGKTTVLISDSTTMDRHRSRIKEVIKSLALRKLYDAAFTAGGLSSEYLISLGFKHDRIWKGVDVVDNGHFSKPSALLALPPGFPNNFFLTVARLDPEKNISGLLAAFTEYKQNSGTWGLMIVGAGLQEGFLKKHGLSVAESVLWYGAADYQSLPSIYQSASCFVLASRSEPWGLVVNEAMSAGLPVLVSNKCGCAPDLVLPGVNGYHFDPEDGPALSTLMENISNSQDRLESMGMESRRIISGYTPETWADTILEICRKLYNHAR
jgi:glycosyltransferase involved in cell wall biosynthesis